MSLLFIGYLIIDAWNWFKVNSETLSPEATAAVFAFLGMLIPIFKWTITYIGTIEDKNEREN